MKYESCDDVKRFFQGLLNFFIALEDLVTAAHMLGSVIIKDDIISLTYEGPPPSVRNIRTYYGAVLAGDLDELGCHEPLLGNDIAQKLESVLKALAGLVLLNIGFKRYSSASHKCSFLPDFPVGKRKSPAGRSSGYSAVNTGSI